MSTKDEKSSSRVGFEWLYPDLLSKEQLCTTLKQRYIHVADLESLEKEGLVELYNQYIIPLPQRKYRHNRRGRDMTVKQVKMAKKRRAAPPDFSVQPPEKRRSTGNLMTSFESPPPVGDRLKPPPSCIDTSKKKIKLGSSSASSSTTSPSSVQPVSSSLNKLKLTKSDSQTATKDSDHSPKKIRLKNSVKVTSSGDHETKVLAKTESGENGSSKVSEGSSDKVSEVKAQEPMDTSEPGSAEKSNKKKMKLTKISWP